MLNIFEVIFMSEKKRTFVLKVLPIVALCVVMLIPSIYACIIGKYFFASSLVII